MKEYLKKKLGTKRYFIHSVINLVNSIILTLLLASLLMNSTFSLIEKNLDKVIDIAINEIKNDPNIRNEVKEKIDNVINNYHITCENINNFKYENIDVFIKSCNKYNKFNYDFIISTLIERELKNKDIITKIHTEIDKQKSMVEKYSLNPKLLLIIFISLLIVMLINDGLLLFIYYLSKYIISIVLTLSIIPYILLKTPVTSFILSKMNLANEPKMYNLVEKIITKSIDLILTELKQFFYISLFVLVICIITMIILKKHFRQELKTRFSS